MAGFCFYTITPSTPVSNADYIVNSSCQGDGATATSRSVHGSMSASSFQVVIYLNNTTADCIFHFTVLS
jgi:hypothetical protein